MKNINETHKKILDFYSNYVLRNNKKPVNVFTFCEEHNLSESEFYGYYANFDQLEEDYLRFFLRQSIMLISAEENYEHEIPKNKMLSLYFTFIEQLTMNRSLIMYLLGSKKNNLHQIKKVWTLKPDFVEFVNGLNLSVPMIDVEGEKMERLEKFKNKGITELNWGNFLAILKFWLEDTSPNFEKTDIFIEKSVDTGFELLDVKPLRKLVDLGKFLFNEKIKNS